MAAAASFPIPALVQLTVPDDADRLRVDAALGAMVDNVLGDGSEEGPPPAAPDQQFHLQFIPAGVSMVMHAPGDLIPIVLTLDPERIPAQAQREARSIYIVEGTDGLNRFFSSLSLTAERYIGQGVMGFTPTTLPNASSFDTVAKVQDAARRLYRAHDDAYRGLMKEAETAVAKIGERAVKIGQARLEEVRTTIVDETAKYFDYAALGHGTPESFLRRETKVSLALRGPGVRDLVAAIGEIDRDRAAVVQASAAVATSPPQYLNAQFDFEDATKALMSTLEVVCDDHPVLYRIWDKVSLPRDVHFDARGQLLGRPGPSNAAVMTLRLQLFETLTKSYRANVKLHDDLDTSNVWNLPPLIDLALEDVGEAGPTVWYRAAQERLQAKESMSVAGILSIVTGVLEMGGVFLAAEPPVLLVLAVASAVLSAIDIAQEFFELRTEDHAYLASLDPQLSLSTEPSYVGFYVSVALSVLDIKGVRDAMRSVRLARYGDVVDDAVSAYRGAL